MNVEFKDLIDYCYALSLATKMRPTEDSVYRSICRKYSKRFSTPLHLVFEMDLVNVILNVYEDDLTDINLVDSKFDSAYDAIRTMEDPSYERQKEEVMDKVVEQAIAEEAERVAKGMPVAKPKNTVSAFAPKEMSKKPTGGSANLSSLSEEDPG